MLLFEQKDLKYLIPAILIVFIWLLNKEIMIKEIYLKVINSVLNYMN